jgi:hypothetical protein
MMMVMMIGHECERGTVGVISRRGKGEGEEDGSSLHICMNTA